MGWWVIHSVWTTVTFCDTGHRMMPVSVQVDSWKQGIGTGHRHGMMAMSQGEGYVGNFECHWFWSSTWVGPRDGGISMSGLTCVTVADPNLTLAHTDKSKAWRAVVSRACVDKFLVKKLFVYDLLKVPLLVDKCDVFCSTTSCLIWLEQTCRCFMQRPKHTSSPCGFLSGSRCLFTEWFSVVSSGRIELGNGGNILLLNLVSPM